MPALDADVVMVSPKRFCISKGDEAAATHFASIAAGWHKSGTPMGSMDAKIAGHAMATGAVLVTRNARHFLRVPDATVENWSQEQ